MMKRWMIIVGIAVLVIGALAVTIGGVVYAGTALWQRGDGPHGPMMGNGEDIPGPRGTDDDGCVGPMDGVEDGLLQETMHTSMMQTFAQKLGLSVDALQARLDAGETLWQIASAQGVSREDFANWMSEARTAALDQAVAAGTITQEQADWMKQHMQGRFGGMHGNWNGEQDSGSRGPWGRRGGSGNRMP
jgi:hypothetical protein